MIMAQDMVQRNDGDMIVAEDDGQSIINGFPQARTMAYKVEQFNAQNSATSLNDIGDDEVIGIRGIMIEPGSRKDRTTGIPQPCLNTYLLTDKGGLFSQSGGIAKSARFILMRFGKPEDWPDGKLQAHVKTTALKNGNTLKSIELVG